MKKKLAQKKQTKKQVKQPIRTIRDDIADDYPDTDLLFMTETEFDGAIMGVCDGISIEYKPKVAYDYDKVIEANVKMGMTYEEAVEHFSYNQSGAYVGEHTPVFIVKYKQNKGDSK